MLPFLRGNGHTRGNICAVRRRPCNQTVVYKRIAEYSATASKDALRRRFEAKHVEPSAKSFRRSFIRIFNWHSSISKIFNGAPLHY